MRNCICTTTVLFLFVSYSLYAQPTATGNESPAVLQPGEGDISASSLTVLHRNDHACQGEESIGYQLQYNSGALQGPVQLSATGLPAEVQIQFSTTTLFPGDLVNVNLWNTGMLVPGYYQFWLQAEDELNTREVLLTFEVEDDPIEYLQPYNGEEIAIKSDGRGLIEFSYDPVPGALNYIIRGDEFGDIDNGLELSRIVDFGEVVPEVSLTFRLLVTLEDTTLISCDHTITFVAALPVEWLGVQAHPRDGGIVIEWQVVQDARGRKYTIERQSSDGVVTNIATIDDNGELGEVAYYYRDETVEKGTLYYYRILQEDQDGIQNYSPWQTAKSEGIALPAYELAPNPVTDEVMLIGHGEWQGVQYQIFDVQGRLLQEGSLSGTKTFLDLRGLHAAVYYLQIIHNGVWQQRLRFFKH